LLRPFYSYLLEKPIPYVQGGTDLNEGLNCYGLCKEFYKGMGLDIPYYNHPDERSLINLMFVKGIELCDTIGNPEPYCMALFALRRPEQINHIGIVLENKDNFIHILINKCVSIQRLSDPFYKARIKGFYKWKNNISSLR